jgi:hypothetical protein
VRHDIKLYAVRYLITIGLWSMVCLLWQGLEITLYGEIQPRKVDNIIGTIIAISIYLNVKQWIKGVL